MKKILLLVSISFNCINAMNYNLPSNFLQDIDAELGERTSNKRSYDDITDNINMSDDTSSNSASAAAVYSQEPEHSTLPTKTKKNSETTADYDDEANFADFWAMQLEEAVKAQDVAQVTQMLQMKVNPNSYNNKTGNLPLTVALITANIEIIKLLLQTGANPNYMPERFDIASFKDKYPQYANQIDYVQNLHIPIVAIALKLKSLPAIQISIMKNQILTILQLLLNYGADLSITDMMERIPLAQHLQALNDPDINALIAPYIKQ